MILILTALCKSVKSSARLLIAARYCAEIAFLRAEWSNYLYDDQLPDN